MWTPAGRACVARCAAARAGRGGAYRPLPTGRGRARATYSGRRASSSREDEATVAVTGALGDPSAGTGPAGTVACSPSRRGAEGRSAFHDSSGSHSREAEGRVMSTSRDRSRRHRPPGPQRDPGIGVPSPCLSARWRWAGSKAPDIRIEALVATLGAAVGNLSAVLTQTGRGSAQIEHPAGERVPGEAVEPEDPQHDVRYRRVERLHAQRELLPLRAGKRDVAQRRRWVALVEDTRDGLVGLRRGTDSCRARGVQSGARRGHGTHHAARDTAAPGRH